MSAQVVKLVSTSTAFDAESVRNRVQAELRAKVAGLKQTSKETRASKALLDLFDGYDPGNGSDPDGVARCEKAVAHRLKSFKRKGTLLSAAQQRDLLIIVTIGAGKVSKKLRLDACALLQLGGSEESVKQMCEAFPGFREALGKNPPKA